jgi:AbrB family looped-hinge helix DNA binding protein
MPRPASIVRVSSKGQIVIPAGLRRKLGLHTGQTLAVRAGNGREVVFAPIEERAPDLDDMLRRTRAWAARSGRDLVEELHRRRRVERQQDATRREHRGR